MGATSLNSGAYATMTGENLCSMQGWREARLSKAMRQPGLGQSSLPDKTSRNVFESHMAALSRAGQVGYYRTPTSLRPPLIATSGAMDASDLESSRLRYDDSASGRCLVAYTISEPCCALSGLSPARPSG